MFGVSRFKGRVAVIAGAEHPLARLLCARLAAFGATVVAIGADADVLGDLALESPERIEPLPLDPMREDALDLLQEAWGEEPLDIYVDAAPLVPGLSGHSAPGAFHVSAGLAAALVPGLRAAQGRAVMCVPTYLDSAQPENLARSAGFRALMAQFSRDAAPGRFIGLSVPGHLSAWTDAANLSASDTIMMLCHPVSRGVRSGSMVDWASA